MIQTNLLSYLEQLESWIFSFKKNGYHDYSWIQDFEADFP